MTEHTTHTIMHTKNISDTTFFIMQAHFGQYYGKHPYWTHPFDVAAFGQSFFGADFDEDTTIVALLHDVIEDTPHTRKSLADMGYSDTVLDAVELVTKDENLTYFENIQRIVDSKNKIAMMVKFSDNYKNYKGDKSDWSESRRKKSQEKYLKSMKILANELNITIPNDIGD